MKLDSQQIILKDKLEDAFKTVPLPGIIVDFDDGGESEDVKKAFSALHRKNDWLKILQENDAALSFFSDQAYKYYFKYYFFGILYNDFDCYSNLKYQILHTNKINIFNAQQINIFKEVFEYLLEDSYKKDEKGYRYTLAAEIVSDDLPPILEKLEYFLSIKKNRITVNWDGKGFRDLPCRTSRVTHPLNS